MAELSDKQKHQMIEGKAFPWHEVYVPDVDAAVEFYTRVLGMTTQDYPMEGGHVYKMLCVDGVPVAGMMSTNHPEMPPGVPPHWAVYIGTEDVDGCVERCKSAGGQLVHGPFDVPNVGRMALLADSQGAHFWVYRSSNPD